MTEVGATTTTTGLSNTNSIAQAAAEQSSETVSDFNDFLTLMTAQLKNQDPLSPLDATTFVEQLASFSAVEQAVSTNQKLDELIGQYTGETMTDLAAWVGRDVTATTTDFNFDGEALAISVPANANADRASVVIRDENGREIATLPASPEGGEVTWDGSTPGGGAASAGLYKVQFVYGSGATGTSDATTTTRDATTTFTGRVKEARIEDGQSFLVLDNGQRVSTEDVTAVVDANAVADAADTVEDAAETVSDVVDAVTG